MPTTSRTPAAALLILGSCTSLQLGAALATSLLAKFGPGLTTGMRLGFAAVLLVTIHRPRFRQWDRKQWRAVVLFGVAMAGMNGFFYAALARIPLGIAVTVEFAGPLVLAAVLSRRRRDLGCVAAVAVAIAVLGLTGTGSHAGHPDLVGVGLALIAGAFWAGYIVTGKAVGSSVPGQGPLALGVAIAALVVAPFGLSAVPALSHDLVELVPLVAVGVLSSFIPYSLEFVAMRRLSSRTFGVLLCLEPVVAGIAGRVLLGQSLGWLHVLAMGVVVAASITSTLGAAAARAPSGEQPVDLEPLGLEPVGLEPAGAP